MPLTSESSLSTSKVCMCAHAQVSKRECQTSWSWSSLQPPGSKLGSSERTVTLMTIGAFLEPHKQGLLVICRENLLGLKGKEGKE